MKKWKICWIKLLKNKSFDFIREIILHCQNILLCIYCILFIYMKILIYIIIVND